MGDGTQAKARLRPSSPEWSVLARWPMAEPWRMHSRWPGWHHSGQAWPVETKVATVRANWLS